MAYRLVRTPWALAARAAAAAGFGLLTLAWPTMTVATFIGLFAAFAVVDGALTLVTAMRFRSRGRDARGLRDPLFAIGAAGVAGGVTAALWSDVTMQALLALMAVWAAATGGGQLAFSLRARPRLPGAWLLGGAGAAGVALAALLVLSLLADEVRVGWEVGGYGVVVGALLGMLAARLHAADARPDDADATVASVPAEATAP
jgi:uncharacterized membrane protein HdeD (DUF308 family)